MKRLSLFILLSITCGLFIGCNTTKTSKPMVVSTTGMINNLVKEIGQHHVVAIGLMGPGIDPHLYKATANDVKRLANADIIFYNGLHLEAKMIDIFKKMNQSKPTIAITKNIKQSDLLAPPEYEGFYDPHVWFDITLWQIAAEEVKNGLIALDPKNKQDYEKNHRNYQQQLSNLNQWIKAELSNIPSKNRTLITAHDAFGYFSKAYNIEVIGLQGISTSSEAGTKDIQNVTNIIVDKNIPTIFIETSVPIRTIKAVQAAVAAKGKRVAIGEELYTDALGASNTPEGTYIGMIKHNVNSIVKGLSSD